MIITTRSLVSIDDEATASSLIESWKNGNKTHVLDRLERDHPGLTALVIVHGSTEKTLSIADCNEITNKLLDRRIALARKSV